MEGERGDMAETAHSFLAQVLFPPDAQSPGVQLREPHRSNGVPPMIGSSHPACDSASVGAVRVCTRGSSRGGGGGGGGGGGEDGRDGGFLGSGGTLYGSE